MAPKYTLTYFNGRGLAELSRLVLAQAGVDYEDKRIEKEQWPQYKPDTPFGKLPMLTVDGEQISESRAIARFIAKQHGLAGKTDVEAAKADSLVDAVYDSFMETVKARFEPDEAKKAELLNKYFTESLPKTLVYLQAFLEKNGSNGFVIGDSFTWADIPLAAMIDDLKTRFPEAVDPLLKNHKPLVEHSQKIFSLPAIKDWIDKRPVTDF